MIFPRMQKKYGCLTLEQNAYIMAIAEFILHLCMVILFFIFSETTYFNYDEKVVATVFTVAGILFLIPCIFSLVLIVGLRLKHAKLIYVFTIYRVIESVLYSLLLLIIGIYVVCKSNNSNGWISILLSFTCLITSLYGSLLTYNIYLNYKEEQEFSSADEETHSIDVL